MGRSTLQSLRIGIGLSLVVVIAAAGYHFLHSKNSDSPVALLARADEMSWLNSWIAAAPLYHHAEASFIERHDLSKALYARVSQMPAQSESSISFPAQIAELTQLLTSPEAKEPETRLRILTIRGMLEVNYDAGMARNTWATIEALALQRHHYLLASRALGEQGIAAFLLGDIATAKKDVIKAWAVAKVADPGARIRYAGAYGAGLVELKKYKEALGPLEEAIKVARDTPGAAYPTIAIIAKIEALSGVGQTHEALALATSSMQQATNYHLAGHLAELYRIRAGVYGRSSQWDEATADYLRSVQYAKELSSWRDLTQIDGFLAQAYEHQGKLQPALAAINEAIEANQHIPDELYFVPRNLAIKADITGKLGNKKASNDLYQTSADLIDALLSKVPTPNVERQLLSELSEVYLGCLPM
jgi:tetratricopeptide (TPR) repeat protein